MCPKTSEIEGHWDKSVLLPLIEARIDQLQNKDDGSEHLVQLKEIADLVDPVISAFAQGRSMVSGVLSELTSSDLEEDNINCTAPGHYAKPEGTNHQHKKEMEMSEPVLDKPPSTSKGEGEIVAPSEAAESSTRAEIDRFFEENLETTTDFASSTTTSEPEAIGDVKENEDISQNPMQSKLGETQNEEDKVNAEMVKALGARVFNEILTAINQQ